MIEKLNRFSDYINPVIEAFLTEKEPIENLTDGVFYSIEAGGKKIRPFLCYEVCRHLRGDVDKVVPFAAVMEIMHNWILIHDDIQDGDTFRRNKPTIWAKYGVPHAINIGDFLQNKVYQITIEEGKKILDNTKILKILNLISETIIYTTQGQALDINLRNDDSPTLEKYIRSVMLKAGYYLACPMIVGAIVADADDSIIETITHFGKYIGPAFQIRDDLIDLTTGKGRNYVIGNDIREGKRTLIVIHTLSNCSQKEKQSLINILNKDRSEVIREEVDWTIELFKKSSSIDYAENYAQSLIEKAKNETGSLPSDLSAFLKEIAEFMIKRVT